MTSDDVVCFIQGLISNPNWKPKEGNFSAEAAIEPENQRPPSELEEEYTTEGETAEEMWQPSGSSGKSPSSPVSGVPEGSVVVTKDQHKHVVKGLSKYA